MFYRLREARYQNAFGGVIRLTIHGSLERTVEKDPQYFCDHTPTVKPRRTRQISEYRPVTSYLLLFRHAKLLPDSQP